MEGLKVPFGLNEAGELISAEAAEKGMTYSCPSCSVKLIHRSGDIRTKHFSHPPSSNCGLETVLHKTAKKLITQAINQNAAGKKVILLKSPCHNCGIEHQKELPPGLFSGANEEVKVSDYICDVAGYRDTEIALAIEVKVTHAVGAAKAKNLPINWIELEASDVISNPYQWNPIQCKLKASYCNECKSHLKHVQKIAEKWGIDRSLYSPVRNPAAATYIADTEICFKCKEEIPVFWWSGVPFCEIEPPNPKPKTIKYRNSKQYGGSYWANTCSNCNMIQGDNYLYIFESAPFKGMPLSGEQSSHTSQSGLVKIKTGDSVVSEFMKIINRNF